MENKVMGRFQGDFWMAVKTPAQSQVLFHARWSITGGYTGLKLCSKPDALLFSVIFGSELPGNFLLHLAEALQ